MVLPWCTGVPMIVARAPQAPGTHIAHTLPATCHSANDAVAQHEMRKIQMSLHAAQLILCMWKVARATSAGLVRHLVSAMRMVVGPGALTLFGSEELRVGALQSLCDLAKSLLGDTPRKSTDADPVHGTVDHEVAVLMLQLGALDVLFDALQAVQYNDTQVSLCWGVRARADQTQPHFTWRVLPRPGAQRVHIAAEADPGPHSRVSTSQVRGGTAAGQGRRGEGSCQEGR